MIKIQFKYFLVKIKIHEIPVKFRKNSNCKDTFIDEQIGRM